MKFEKGNNNEKINNTVCLISKTTIRHMHHTFQYISLPLLHDYDLEMPNFTIYGERKQATSTKFSFPF